MPDKDLASEIPDFVKKYVPGITRGLSWAKYSEEKQKGTEIKVDAYNESKEKGFQKAIEQGHMVRYFCLCNHPKQHFLVAWTHIAAALKFSIYYLVSLMQIGL